MWILVMLALATAATADCPRHCECKWRSGKESVICIRANFTALPSKFDVTTQLVDLTGNKLITLRNDIFVSAGLLNLQRLYLSSCYIRYIRQYAFRGLVNLVDLDISYNHLEFVPSHSFDSVPELRELRLGGNFITKIEDEAFSILPHLVRLSLSACKITEIGPRAFVGLEGSLEYLELSHNKLHVLDIAVLAPLRSLKGLELADNPWECTCALRPMRDWMIKKNVPATVVPNCVLPLRLSSRLWNQLELEDFACQPEVNAISQNVKGIEGESVTLICKVTGVPAPRVRWMRAGRLIANSSFNNVNSGRAFILRSEGHTSNLTIKSADIQDIGTYMCNAENRAGKAELTFSLTIDKKIRYNGFGGRGLMAGMAVSAVIVLTACVIGLCAYETRKKRQLDRHNEQRVITNRRDDSYEKIEANAKHNVEVPLVITNEISRKRGDYQNVPSHDPEDDVETYNREMASSIRPSLEPGCRSIGFESSSSSTTVPASQRDLHIPYHRDYNIRADATSESVTRSNSTGIRCIQMSERKRFNNYSQSRTRSRPCERFDNELSGSDSEKNYPDIIEMSALGTNAFLKSEINRDPYYFYTMPRRKVGESYSPLLSSRRNSSGGDSVTLFDRFYEKTRYENSRGRSNSFLDLSTGGKRLYRNPSLPASPLKERSTVPSATPLLNLSGLQDFTRTEQPLGDINFRALQLETFLDEYISVKEYLLRMKEARENLERNRAIENEDISFHGSPSVAVTEASSSVALADAASPLALSAAEYTQQPRPEWLTSLLYRN